MFSFSKILRDYQHKYTMTGFMMGLVHRIQVKISFNHNHSVNVQGGKHILLNAVNMKDLLSAWTQ